MITRINGIENYRVFKGWRWSSGTPDFATVNLIYGINGSGKSTLGCLLGEAAKDVEWTTGLSAQVVVADGTARRTGTAADGVWQEIRVFNRGYVEENLRFDAPDGSAAEGLLVLGKQSIADREAREDALKRLEHIEQQTPELQRKLKKTRRIRDQLATTTARQIAETVGHVDRRYDSPRYKAPQVKAALAGPAGSVLLGGHSAEQDAQTISAQARQAIVVPQVDSYTLDEVAAKAQELLGESATGKAIAELAEHSSHAQWVQEGMKLHEQRDDCIFCSNTVSAERRAALAAHFDASVRRQQQRIDQLLGDIRSLTRDCESAIESLPHRSDLLASKQHDYVVALSAIEDAGRQFADGLARLQKLLLAKRDAPFKPAEERVTLPVRVVSLNAAVRVIVEHNEEVDEFDARRRAAAERIASRRIADIRDEYLELDGEVRTGEEAIHELDNERAALRKLVSEMANDDLDPTPLAKMLNSDVAALLGREELSFSVAGGGYRITRDGQPAHHLSEGERNAISLLYFLRSLEAHGTEAKKCIVVIDDPVSSLDGNALVGASAHLWARLVEREACRQLFMLTHNFELFRMWVGQLQQRDAGSEQRRHEVYEIRCVARRGENAASRAPVILAWPNDAKLRKRLQSEYHYLFWRVASALEIAMIDPSPQHDMEVAAVMPNVCRRLLEGFLAFKSPGLLGKLTTQVMQVPARSIDAAQRTRVLRFVHAYSHNEAADGGAGAARPEATEMLGAVLRFIRAVDDRHFNEMCSAVGVKVQLDTSKAA